MAVLARIGNGFREALRGFRLGSSRAYQRRIEDGARAIRLDQVTPQSINGALDSARMGNLAQLGDLVDILATHPVIKGIRNSRKAGVKRVEHEIQAANDSARAVEAADRVRAMWKDPRSKTAALLDSSSESILRGAGLTEILWAREGKDWSWRGFQPIPQNRLRYDRRSGELAFAPSAMAFTGIPIGAYLPGTFVSIVVDQNIPDFSLRGADRSVLTDWFGLINVGGWWTQDIQNWGQPILHAQAKSDTERKAAEEELAKLGPGGKFATGPGITINPIEKRGQTGKGGMSPHEAFESSREKRISIAYLGASQAVTVQKDAGSQATGEEHMKVREDVLVDDWTVIAENVEGDLFRPWMVLTYGAESIEDTPRLVPKWKKAVDVGKVLDSFQKARGLGIDVTESFVYEALQWPKPGPKDKLFQFREAEVQPGAEKQPAPGHLVRVK